jgi:hypothetical protein
MFKEIPMTKSENAPARLNCVWSFGLRHYLVIRHYGLVIFHGLGISHFPFVLIAMFAVALAGTAQTLTITNGVQTYVGFTNTTVTMSNQC